MNFDKLNKWADLLLDTGKRNNLINFKDSKSSTVEVVAPDYATVVSRLAHANVFEVYDPKLNEEDDFEEYVRPRKNASAITTTSVKKLFEDGGKAYVPREVGEDYEKTNVPRVVGDNDINADVPKVVAEYSQITDMSQVTNEDTSKFDEYDVDENSFSQSDSTLSKSEYIQKYKSKLNKNQILTYSLSNKPMLALKNIKNRAKTFVEETGVNIAYIAIGFIKWTENVDSNITMRAPVLLLPITIERQSSVTPFYIKIADDEIIVNPTFAFKLQNEFGITLPEYDLGDDIDDYFDTVEDMLSKIKWTIDRECKIGLFSFMKINMYKDIKTNAQQIVQNKNIQVLLGESVQGYPEMWGGIANEGGYESLDLHNVVDADSSQIEAIEMARQGKSFVLQGPPGTGKSQTITNIIAESLYCGKKVLFVSEKLAALQVVYEKLQRVGLEEFCLELHSHKANKKMVIEELCKTLRLPKSKLSERAGREQKAKKDEQQKLDSYAKELHKKQPVINKSLFELYGMLSSCRKTPDFEYIIEKLSVKGDDYLDRAQQLLGKFADYQTVIGYNYKKHFWYGYKGKDVVQSEKLKLKTDLTQAVDVCKQLEEIIQKVEAKFDVKLVGFKDTHLYCQVFDFLASSKFITPEFLDITFANKVKKVINEQITLAQEIKQLKSEIDLEYDEDIFNLNGKAIYKQLSKQFDSLFSRLFSKEYKKIITDLKLSSKSKKINYKVALKDIEALCEYQKNKAQFYTLKKSIEDCLNDSYNDINTDFQTFICELDDWSKLYDKVNSPENLQKIMSDFDVESKRFFANIASSLQSVFAANDLLERSILEAFDKTMFDVETMSFDQLINKFSACADNMEQLFDWCGVYRLIGDLKNEGLLDFVDFAIQSNVSSDNLVNVYNKIFYTQWIEDIMHKNDIFMYFPRIHHDKSVELFKDKDRLDFDINKAIIKAELSENRPDLNMTVPGSSIAKLLREGEKKRKQKSVRTLFAEMTELIQILKPCMLMSPLSVSTFLGPDVDFDIVIFDEASQIFPQDAISVIYRGKQLVVVGDSKQMPPSKFFTAELNTSEDDEEEDVTDFESILDLCSVLLPQCRLKWHYRSKFEQLISFSNKNFYDDSLVTFPSYKNACKDTGVDYTHVDGVFDRKSKTNKIEAEKIVDMVFEHIQNHPERSLGVVAFSISQQGLIEKLISKRREKDPRFEQFFSEENPEPFFVKNLETVQGDERDTIIFSIAYAKDAQGKLLLNFGPLNRVGGERRLNVAVTRAKFNLKVVSSMRHTDIDLSRVKSVGAMMLYNYLYYAEIGSDDSEQIVIKSAYDMDEQEFEKEVCEFLQNEGYEVDMQVGRSTFKIDLAIKKPKTNDYVLAIECDGETYRSSKTTRDRDRLRQDVLERMGWKFYRIWSADWFRNKPIEKQRLLDAVENAFKDDTVQAKNEVLAEVNFEEQATDKPFEFPKYKKVDEVRTARACEYNLLKTVYTMLDVEGPLSEEWLLKRICFMFGREKVTSVVIDNFNYRMRACERVGIVRKGGFLYIKNREVPMLRVPEDGDTPREIKYIMPEELANGLLEILNENVCVEKNGLFRLTAQKLGFSRIGDTILACMNKALKLIADKVEIDGDMVKIKD